MQGRSKVAVCDLWAVVSNSTYSGKKRRAHLVQEGRIGNRNVDRPSQLFGVLLRFLEVVVDKLVPGDEFEPRVVLPQPRVR